MSASILLERFRYWQGQMLRSRDFRDQVRVADQLQTLHNRALHSAAGLSFGLEVTDETVDGKLILTVRSGLAYDCESRPVLLRQDRTIEAPPGNATQTLVLRGEPASLEWRAAERVRMNDGVPLVRITYSDGVPRRDPEFRAPQARPVARPRLATGETVRGDTPWEPWSIQVPDSRGGERAVPVGVQTRIDTSAAGFTAIPCYFASLTAPQLDLRRDAFAPAYFSHIADASVDGFTFRLLMLGVGRRSVKLATGAGRVTAVLTRNPERMVLSVDSVSPFRAGDVIARVRPRATSMTPIAEIDNQKITLISPIVGLQIGDTLATGNTLRLATVAGVRAQDKAMVVAVDQPQGIKAGDALVRLGDGMETLKPVLIDSVADSALTLSSPIKALSKGDAVGSASLADLVTVLDVKGPRKLVTVDKPEAFHKSDVVFRVGPDLELSFPALVSEIQNQALALTPDIEGLKPGEKLALVTRRATVTSVGTVKRAMSVEVDRPGLFREGDWIARRDASGALSGGSSISSIAGKVLTLATPIEGLKKKDTLAAADVLTSVTVLAVGAQAGGMTVTVEDSGGLRVGDLVARSGSEAAGRVAVAAIAGNVVTLAAPISGLQGRDVVTVAAFPGSATVQAIAQQTGRTLVQVADGSVFRPSDSVRRADDDTLALVDAVAGNVLSVRGTIGLKAGDTLTAVRVNDAAAITDITPAAGQSVTITLAETIAARQGDFAARLESFSESSDTAVVESAKDNTLVLSGDLDGLLPDNLLAQASITAAAGRMRLEGKEDLRPGDQLMLTGVDERTGQFTIALVTVVAVDPAANAVFVIPATPGASYRFRPEAVMVAATFNANFTTAFAAFARRQGLYVCWFGCQQESAATPIFPDAGTAPPCG